MRILGVGLITAVGYNYIKRSNTSITYSLLTKLVKGTSFSSSFLIKNSRLCFFN